MSQKLSLSKIAISPDEHFRFLVFDFVICILEREVSLCTLDAFMQEYPFLHSYTDRILQLAEVDEIPSQKEWRDAIDAWGGGNQSLPFYRLSGLGLDHRHRLLLIAIAAVEEDPRLSLLMQAEGGAPSIGGLSVLFSDLKPEWSVNAIRNAIFDLTNLDLVEVTDKNLPRIDWKLRLKPIYFDLLTGGNLQLKTMMLTRRGNLPSAAKWVAPTPSIDGPEAIAKTLQASDSYVVHVAGERHNGRKTLLCMIAKSAGLNVLKSSSDCLSDSDKWQDACLLAHLTGAMLLIEIEPGPGQSLSLPSVRVEGLKIAIAGPKTSSVDVPTGVTGIPLELSRPDKEARSIHWQNAGLGKIKDELAGVMLTSGNIYRASNAALALAKIEGEKKVIAEQVYAAAQGLRDSRLDAIAARIDSRKQLDELYLDHQEQEELDALVLRCRFREQLHQSANSGVKAILSGPSGTGKTLAAQHIAARLKKELYRIDLSATVNKYIGETEKGLERALAAAEEMDVVLLLDEGDALMARRTDVSSSTDRYANLETNFLLQRLESFSGIILVTTNDGDRIDGAFSRRMDAIIPFRLPDEMRRLEILKHQLVKHQVSDGLLQDISCRCVLSGGQLHNVAVHARLLSLGDDSTINDEHLLLALRREYRKNGEHCPLKPALAAVG